MSKKQRSLFVQSMTAIEGCYSYRYPNAAIRTATMILSRDDYDFPVCFIVLKLN